MHASVVPTCRTGRQADLPRKMDLLNGDLLLKNEATSKGKGKKGKMKDDENEAGFHFIAFVPIENQLWKLDGLERQPVCLGEQFPLSTSISDLVELLLMF